MSLSNRSKLAEAVKAELNAAPAGTFAAALWPAGGAVRCYEPVIDLAALASTHVTVLARSVDLAPLDRSRTDQRISIDVAVQKKIASDAAGAADADEMDSLCLLVEQVLGFLTRRRLAGFPGALWTGCSNDPIYWPTHLAEKRVFTSVITVTYMVVE